MHPGWRLPSRSSTLKLRQLLGRDWCCRFRSLLQPCLSHPTFIDQFYQMEGYRKYNSRYSPKNGFAIGFTASISNSSDQTVQFSSGWGLAWPPKLTSCLVAWFHSFGMFWNHHFACCIYSSSWNTLIYSGSLLTYSSSWLALIIPVGICPIQGLTLQDACEAVFSPPILLFVNLLVYCMILSVGYGLNMPHQGTCKTGEFYGTTPGHWVNHFEPCL